ncbi:MAG: SH3 domain-containing protein [Lachnospiraceae bacterium]|nr:SH3 domain-containing protein [Lachnospiraceae bacterium]
MKKHIMIFAITLTAGVIGSGKPDIMVKAAENNVCYESQIEAGMEQTEKVADSVLESRAFKSIYEVTAKAPIKSGAGSSYKTIGYVCKGQRFDKISETTNWVKVRYGKTTGYINKSYLKKI